MTFGGPLPGERATDKAQPELADIFRAHGEAFRALHGLSLEQRQVMAAIESCRTSVLGGHADLCQSCGHVEASYNSCRNRHCPKCQALPQARWLAGRMERIVPTRYFHVVFTLPEELRPLALRNRRPLFDLLFKAASQTLLELGKDPKWLGATLGITAVLHSWSRKMHFHPHLHCVVTGGGLSQDDAQWLSTAEDFLFPVRVLSVLFRGKLLDGLRKLYRAGQLDLEGGCAPLRDPEVFAKLISGLYEKSWNVYAKEPFGGPEQVFSYLGRYTHRVAISSSRLLRFDGDRVTFATRDGGSETVSAHELIRRFLLHVLPKGFVRIRHYGLMAASNATTRLELARALLQGDEDNEVEPLDEADTPDGHTTPNPLGHDLVKELSWQELLRLLTGKDMTICPRCGGPTVRVALETLLGTATTPTETGDTS